MGKITGKLKYNVGYNTGGKYKTREKGKITRTYNLWHNMIQRCYDESLHLKFSSYKNIKVTEEWHNYQVFAKDVTQMIGYDSIDENGRVFVLDKDLLAKDNKVYSEDTVCFLPQAINSFLANNYKNKGELPTGVYLNKRDKKYISQMQYNGKHIHLGYFYNPQDARTVYIDARNKYARELAEHYKNKIDPRAYNILANWSEVEHSN